MKTTKTFKNTISTLIMIALSFLIIYFLHDISKAIVGLLCGGKLEFNHGITIVKANYGNFSYILNLILGISIPVLFLFVLVLIFNNSLRNGLYHKFTLIFFMCSVLSISVCLIFYPLISLFTDLGLHTELDELLEATGLSPLVILLLSLLITTLLVKLASKKNLFKNI
ncbi:hypothetical protein QTH11_01100 [Clostridium perfringens]|uniref:hypothetical protein n=1 Tax=Clostridium perfringens TaxID=1502 RepID=UPI001F582E21|nr:hypothetical protein [Clostridium perfringens]MCI2779219.1 hypothetical protein [Clostridium perfringens]MCX0380082.1 hypothetical protein [Clostridium perfringens]MDK0697605.1 hypothetical protein [Clostridium perfringens]MDK0794821.1 hypothetical protein [Clostridium perfringens]MDM0465042.1 hypothetical protein [Clostridium perfringens]